MREGTGRTLRIVVVTAAAVVACSGSGPTRKPRQPHAAARAVQSTGYCYTGRGGEPLPPADGNFPIRLDARSLLAFRYRPVGECGGAREIDYRASFDDGRLAFTGTSSTSTSKSGVSWKMTSPGAVRFIPIGTSAPPSSADAHEYETISSIDNETRSRRVVLKFVRDEDLTHVCIFTLGWHESSGEYEDCDDSDGGGCGDGSGGHDFDD
jgi:hypothetical protein